MRGRVYLAPLKALEYNVISTLYYKTVVGLKCPRNSFLGVHVVCFLKEISMGEGKSCKIYMLHS